MNIQTEHLENRTARFTVEIDQERLETAKQKAARKIARHIRIPGFRKGKAPYRVLVRNGLEPDILNEAIETLSQDLYRETLDQSELEPYGPGTLEDFKMENELPTFVYTVPLQPQTELGDYRSLRLDYEAPVVEDVEVDRTLKSVQRQHAVVEESQHPIKIGDRVTIDLHSTFVDDPPESDDEDDTAPTKGDVFAQDQDAEVDLDPDLEPFLPGFVGALVGADVDDELDFELEIPSDDEEFEDVAGRKVAFNVVITGVKNVTLPELTDEFAARVTEEEDEPLTLLDLRVRIRENLENSAKEEADNAYASEVINAIVDMSNISFPPMMVEEQIDAMIEDLEGRLQQQRMDLETYMRVVGKDEDDIREDYRDLAEQSIRRSLVLVAAVESEQLKVTDAMLDERIDAMVAQFGEQGEQIRSMFDTPQMRNNMATDMIQNLVVERLVAIAKGEEVPEPGAAEDEPEAEVTIEQDAEETAGDSTDDNEPEAIVDEAESDEENQPDDEEDSTSS